MVFLGLATSLLCESQNERRLHHVTGKEWCNFDLLPSVGVYNNSIGTRVVT